MVRALRTAPIPRVDVIEYGPAIVYVENFTPATAQDWLTKNDGNRKVRERDVEKYARDMLAGRFYFTGDPVRRADDGKLLDGQHRLMAIVRAGVTLPLLVVDGLPDHSQLVMDSGRARTYADHLGIQGQENYSIVAATCRFLLLWDHGQPVHETHTPTKAELDEFLSNNEGVRDAAAFAAHVARLAKVAASPIAAVYFTAAKRRSTEAVEFFSRLADGAGLFPGSPIYALRERLIRSRANGERLLGSEIAALIIYAWNAYVSGRTITRLQLPKGGLTNQTFPELAS